jgi:putative membrane protein
METWLPLFNTSLILVSGLAVLAGFLFIRNGNVRYHRMAMITATSFAALFLVVYVTRALTTPTKIFAGEGALRAFYLGILGTHTILATTIIPLVLFTLYRALRGQFGRHRKIARMTLPIWLYVAVSGWVIYLMLYQLPAFASA